MFMCVRALISVQEMRLEVKRNLLRCRWLVSFLLVFASLVKGTPSLKIQRRYQDYYNYRNVCRNELKYPSMAVKFKFSSPLPSCFSGPTAPLKFTVVVYRGNNKVVQILMDLTI